MVSSVHSSQPFSLYRIRGDDKTLSGGAWTQYETRYSSGTLNINSGIDGYINNLTASGSIGLLGKHIAASGKSEGNAGVIFRTDVGDGGKLTAGVNGRAFQLSGKQSYIPLEPYNRYEVEINNNKDSLDSYDIVGGKNRTHALSGNVILIQPSIKQMVTVFGRMRAEDGTLLTHTQINTLAKRQRTVMASLLLISIKLSRHRLFYSEDKSCEASLDIREARGAVWVGDVICQGLKTYTLSTGSDHEG